MTWFERHPIRKDSKSISLLAVFLAMVIASQIVPIVGVTTFKTGVSGMNIDWTGIPIVIVFQGLGIVYSFFSVAAMWISIGYRNFVGAIFKTSAESLMLLGMTTAWLVGARRTKRRVVKLSLYLVFGCAFRAVGMFFVNAALLPAFYPYTPQAAYAISALIVPWNVVQAIINIVGGFTFYNLIPSKLAAEAGLGDGAYTESKRVLELSSEDTRQDAARDSGPKTKGKDPHGSA
jgi:riboflavin transporter FmnP